MSEKSSSAGRPMSPHIQVWRWHWTMAASILHRATGVALYVGAALVTVWLVTLATSQDAYEFFEREIMFSLLGQLVLFGFTLAVLYHFANGIRHLIWDGPKTGFSPGVASAVSVFNFTFAILGAAAIWSAAYFF